MFRGYEKLRSVAIWVIPEPRSELHICCYTPRADRRECNVTRSEAEFEFFISENHPAAVVFSYVP
jgi:hypothetical protein